MQVCGLKEGKKVGQIKSAIEDAILDGKIENFYEAALAHLMEIKDNFRLQIMYTLFLLRNCERV